MTRSIIIIIFLTLFTTLSINTVSSYEGGQSLLFFYSNDVVGETEPCG